MRWRRRRAPAGTTVEVTAGRSARIVVPSASSPLVSIVIVTFGEVEVTLECLSSIVRHTDFIAHPYEVVIVDNADPENARPQPTEVGRSIRELTAGVHLVAHSENTGFGGGNNAGARVARGRYLCLCNPDIEVPPGWLQPLLDSLGAGDAPGTGADPAVGVVAPVLVNPDGSPQEFGQVLLDTGLTLAVGGPDLFPGDWSQARPRVVDYASAAFWLIRRDLFVDHGGFDPRYHPAYWEDVDLALRLEESGYVTRLVPDVRVVHHKGGGSSDASLALAQRSHARFVERWAERLSVQPSHPTDETSRADARDAASRRARQLR